VRHRAIPVPIAGSLFGPGAVHGLDDDAHRHRKTLFLEALTQDQLDRLLPIARRRWRAELQTWSAKGSGHVYPSAVRAFGSTIIEWAGIDEPDSAKAQHAQWMADIVNGFGVLGPAYVRATRARRRCDQWARQLVARERRDPTAPEGSWLQRVAAFVDSDGERLPARTAAVELLNILRPTVAVSWLACFAVMALDEHPQWQARLRAEGPEGRAAEAFAHEVRRYYPFVPVLTARARQDVEFAGHHIERGQRILLDVYGTNHGPEWANPWAFDPDRFLETHPCDLTHFVAQGGGPRETGHRCPGEGVSNGLLAVAIGELASRDGWQLPLQDPQYSLRRMPTRPHDDVRVTV
jgi:fatty-acid peroxygenase